MPEGSLEIRILGPLEIAGSAGPARFPGRTRRALVGSMALRPGEVLTRPQLIEAIWGNEPPLTVVKTLHSHIAVVRRALEAVELSGTLVTRENGYALDVESKVIDAQRFEDEIRWARGATADGDRNGAVRAFQSALGMWRGEVLAGSAPEGWAAAEGARLQELRICATEGLWSAELACGNHADAATELARLAAIHPLREQIWELLMVALYRCGRRAESLQVYERIKSLLHQELSVEPGPRLARLRRLVLAGAVH